MPARYRRGYALDPGSFQCRGAACCTPSRHNRSSLAVVGARDTRAPPRLIGFFVFASDPLDLRSLCRLPLLRIVCLSAYNLLSLFFISLNNCPILLAPCPSSPAPSSN